MKCICLTIKAFLLGWLLTGLPAAAGPPGSPRTARISQSAAGRPNILFVISDDQSFPHTSAYGYKAVRTPAFDRVAREGVLFTNAIVASPGCSPSRAALLTGLNCWQLEQAGTHASSFPRQYVTYPDLLAGAGYFAGYTGKGWGPGEWKVSGRQNNPAGPEYNTIRSKGPAGISNVDYAANFAAFLVKKGKNAPFCFWFGAQEPHRNFEKGIGLKHGKRLADAAVPDFLPDTPGIRSDLLDYCFEIEWADQHLGRMLKLLEEAGELDNTLVVVTSDNGMAFPRAKANVYEYGIHVPLAIRWGNRIPGGRTIGNVVSLTDLAPTFLEAAGVAHPGTGTGDPMQGISLLPALLNQKSRAGDTLRTGVYTSRERHSSSRWNNQGYPQRALRTAQYLYIINFEPDRWPAGDPQKLEKDAGSGRWQPGPMHGGYHDIDACPTLDFLIGHREDERVSPFFHLAVAKRPGEELYDINKDPGCLHNLAGDPRHSQTKNAMKSRLENYLKVTRDPRVTGNGEVFETYERYSPLREFPPRPAVKQ